jgi:hypothetical protein
MINWAFMILFHTQSIFIVVNTEDECNALASLNAAYWVSKGYTSKDIRTLCVPTIAI